MRILLSSSVLLAAGVASAAPAKLQVMSDAFAPNAEIPQQYTCEGAGHAPLLSWSAPPAGTKSFAVLVEDSDAERGPFVHLLVTNLPADQQTLDLGEPITAVANVQRNDTGATGYLAPCPQDGAHHYHYRIYALDGKIAPARANRSVTRASFLRGIAGHVLAEGELVGVYAPKGSRTQARR